MPTNNLEERLAAVEKDLARLNKLTEQANKPWWEEIVGTFTNDPIYEEAMRLGREWREAQRPKAVKKVKKKHVRSRHGSHELART